MSSYSKYLKYKTKYIELKKTYYGGGKESAKQLFINLNLPKKNEVFEQFKTNLENDIEYNYIEVSIPISKENLEELFEIFYNKIKEKFNINAKLDRYIDFIVKIYLNNKFGIEYSSLNFIERLLEAIQNYDYLKNNYKDALLLNNFDGLESLEKYLSTEDIEQKIQDIIITKTSKMEPIFESENVLVYNPQTKEQAIRYGKHTKWCTSSIINNMFEHYKDMGELYIFIGRKDPNSKFQIHFEDNSLMNALDKLVTFEFMLSQFNNDEGLLHFLKQLILNKPELIIKDSKKDVYLVISKNDLIEQLPNYYKIVNELLHTRKDVSMIKLNINIPLENMLSGLINLKTLVFGIEFNQPLGNSLSTLINLEILSFGRDFNQPLEDSLLKLTKLKILLFDSKENKSKFNQSLGNSLSTLINLESIHLGPSFNQPFGDSLLNLKKLENIYLTNNYKHPIDRTLLPPNVNIKIY